MDHDELKQKVSPQPFLVLASALTAAGGVIILIDLYAPRDTIQQTLVNLSMVVMASCWNIYFVWIALRRIGNQLRDTLERDSYARGFVDGVARRDPEGTLRLIRNAS